MGTVAAPSADVANAASKNSWLFRSRSGDGATRFHAE